MNQYERSNGSVGVINLWYLGVVGVLVGCVKVSCSILQSLAIYTIS